ncbi:MAG TPA: benzaldehyde dehydrogenase [Treponema sp.]|nr:benzaldehyde dehydrogenase [Treponema sp.]
MSPATSESREPATGALIGNFPLSTAAEAADRIAAARAVQKDWAALAWRERSEWLGKIEKWLAGHADSLAELIGRDNGKTRIDALAAEVLPAAMALRYYRRHGKRLLRSSRIRGGNILMFNKVSRLRAVPYGVIGIITPWNYPFSIPFSEVVMALLAGNAVVLKVATDTLAVGAALEEAFAAAELPSGLFSYLNIPGKQAGKAFIEGGVDKLFFTGSTAVGRELAALAAPRLLPLVLELGGADAAIVRADADLDRAASGVVWAGLGNAGQSCGGVQRVLVHRSVYDAFLEKLSARVRALRVGPPLDWDSDVGCMTSVKQKRAVRDQIEACLASGARIVARSASGDLDSDDAFLPAIVLADAGPDAPILREEVFGPVLAVQAVDDDEQALRIAAGTPYGLTGSVWSRDRSAARALAARMNAGAVTINDHLISHGLAETPWGGFGDSGFGRTHGEAGFREMFRTQVIVDDILPFAAKSIWWHPYSRKLYDGLRALLDVLYAPGITRRLAAIPRVLRIFLRYWERP